MQISGGFPPPYQNSVALTLSSSSTRQQHSPQQQPGSSLEKPVSDVEPLARGSSTDTAPNKEAPNTTTSADSEPSAEKQQQAQEERQIQLEVRRLSARDREVRNHERAHAAVGGQYAGAPKYQYERGPDGVNYAVAGEVSISTSSINGNPQATIEKAQIVRRAALAPAEPSAQDRRVAAQASQIEIQARTELNIQQREERLQAEKEEENREPDNSQETSLNDEKTNVATVNEDDNNQSVTDNDAYFLSVDVTRRLLNTSFNPSMPTTGRIISRYA